MSDSAQQPSSSDQSTPHPALTDDQLVEMGVDPSARSTVEAFMAFSVLLVKGKNYIAFTAGRLWAWANRNNDRRFAVVATISALVLGAMLWNGKPVAEKPEPPVVPKTADTTQKGFKTQKVASGESWESIAKTNGITPDELRAANTDLIEQNTAWCNARPTSAFYRAGFLEDGKTPRNGTFCQLFNGKALETLRENQALNVPIVDHYGPMLTGTVNRPN